MEQIVEEGKCRRWEIKKPVGRKEGSMSNSEQILSGLLSKRGGATANATALSRRLILIIRSFFMPNSITAVLLLLLGDLN